MPFYSHSLYALGWIVETYRGRTVIGHRGNEPGFNSLVRYLPELEWGVVIFRNSSGAWEAVEMICSHLIDELLNVPIPDRFDLTAVLQAHEKTKPDENQEGALDCPFSVQPGSPLGLSAPVTQYTGKYHNAGYHDLNLEIKDGKLWADCTDRCFGFILSLEHCSAYVFIAEIRDIENNTRRVRAEFKLDADKRVSALGVAFVPEMKPELIWFDRVIE
jgi:hypothetical protein